MFGRDFSGHRRWLLLFSAIAVLVLAQVAWWIYVFVNDVTHLAELRLELAKLTGTLTPELERAIRDEAYHRRLMFLSESAFFGLLTLLGHFFIYRGWKADRKTRELQRNFIEIVSHESKTPLTALKLRLESLRETKASDPEVARTVGLSLDQVARLSSILEKALNLNRVERGAFHFEEVALGDVVREVVRHLDPLIKVKGVAMTLELDDEVRVKGDLFCLQTSVQNLLENAILYNEGEDKRVTVKLVADGDCASLTIADNGMGIDPREKLQVFERFYRGARSNKVPGTGLGLYLTRIIVEAHHGVIRLLEPAAGGTRFQIRIPLLVEEVV